MPILCLSSSLLCIPILPLLQGLVETTPPPSEVIVPIAHVWLNSVCPSFVIHASLWTF